MNKLAIAALLTATTVAGISPATADTVKITECNGNSCSTTEMSFEDYMRLKGGTVVRKKRRAVASVQGQNEDDWTYFYKYAIRFRGGQYQVKDPMAKVLVCGGAKAFTATVDGDAKVFYCNLLDGSHITIVVDADAEWGAIPIGWWEGHHNYGWWAGHHN